jgi:hypothetical protein
MASFLYFLPDVDLVPSRQTNTLPADLSVTLTDSSWSHRQIYNGPEGRSGSIISVHPSPGSGGAEATCGYFPEKQRWTKVEEGDVAKYWIGYEQRPTPEDLIRESTVSGYPVRLGEQDWVVPCVHAPRSTLPRNHRMTGQGLRLEFDKRYESLMRESERWWNYLFNHESENITFEDQYRFACNLLAVNYRLGLWECSVDCLDLMDTANITQIINAAIGLKAIDEENEMLQKKTGTQPGG